MRHVAPYEPIIYSYGSKKRFRQYPSHVRTSVPGAGYKERLAWAPQRLDLRWSREPLQQELQGLGNYSGLGCGCRDESPSMGGCGCGTSGLGGPAEDDALRVAGLAARILSNPDATLRAEGPRLVAAADRYLIAPLVDTTAQRMVPIVLKYLAPPLVLLYILSGVSAYYAYQAWGDK